jgi:hypothetical protein
MLFLFSKKKFTKDKMNVAHLPSKDKIKAVPDKGYVTETIDCGEYVWIKTREKPLFGDICAFYVTRTPQALCVSEGDVIRWKGEIAYWTPKTKYGRSYAQEDIELNLIAFTGEEKPLLEKSEVFFEK